MDYAELIFRQILLMFLYMAAGFFLYRKRLVTDEGGVGLANVFIYAVLPCVILRSFFTERTPEKLAGLWLSFFWGAVLLLLSMIIAALFFKHRPIDRFGAAFSSAGFIGVPLISAVLGNDAVIYVAGMCAFLNILQWFYGQSILEGKRFRPSPSALLKNPMVLSLLAGIAVFCLALPVPALLKDCFGAVSSMNAPLGMMILGIYLAQTNIRRLFGNLYSYRASAVRLVIISAASLLVLALASGLPPMMRTALLITACAPIGSNVAVYAKRLNKDYVYAVETVCLSTILSLLTLPLMIAAAGLWW